jgi:tryptophan synthase beta chain
LLAPESSTEKLNHNKRRIRMPYHFAPMPDENGYFGEYGGQIIPPQLKEIMDDINDAYEQVRKTDKFKQELATLNADYTGRPSPIYFARRLSEKASGAGIFLKREDLNHTGAHKINHCLGEALLARHMGKTKVLAETGAGQHGVALATACALVGIECEIHMGEIDIVKEHPNVTKMKILGCKLVPVSRGTRTLKDAVDSAFEEYLKDPVNSFYAIGSVVGPHPFPKMVRDFQSIVGIEARAQFLEKQGKLPDVVIACVGGGSNAMGLFTAFLEDETVKMIGVEPAGLGLDTPDNAATLTLGSKGAIHGFECYNLQDEEGNPLPVYSIASGLDYPGVGPQHCYLKDIKRVQYETADDKECLDAFMTLSRLEGIIPALESAHAVAYAMRVAGSMDKDQSILINLSGRGDKDADFVAEKLGL